MTVYRYVIAVTGQVEAPSEEHARLQLLMGVSFTGRLLQAEHNIAIEVRPIEAVQQPSNGPRPVMEH